MGDGDGDDDSDGINGGSGDRGSNGEGEGETEDRLSEGEADTSGLRHVDKGICFVAKAEGRPRGEHGETVL